MRRFAMNYGTVLGLCLILVSLVLWVLDFDDTKSLVPSILNNITIIGFLVYGIIQFRDNINNGFISYSSSLKLGTTIAFFSSVIMAFYSVIYLNYLNPETLSNLLNMTEQTLLEANPEITDEMLDSQLDMVARFMQPHWMMILGVLSGTFTGFLFSSIASIFLKRNNPNEIS